MTPNSPTTGAVVLAGTLNVGNGGTGDTTLAAGGLLAGNGTGAVATVADVAAGSVLVSNGAGSNPVYSATPTLTSVTAPTLIGGAAAGSTLTLELTSGAGTSDAIYFKTGSQTEAMRIDTNGNIGIGGIAPSYQFDNQETITGTSSVYAGRNLMTVSPSTTSVASYYALWNDTISGSTNLTNGVLYGVANSAYNNGTATIGTMYGAFNAAYNNSTGQITSAYGERNWAPNVSTGTIANAYGALNYVQNVANGSITSAVGTLSRIYNTMGSGGAIGTAISRSRLYKHWHDDDYELVRPLCAFHYRHSADDGALSFVCRRYGYVVYCGERRDRDYVTGTPVIHREKREFCISRFNQNWRTTGMGFTGRQCAINFI